jgi:acyl carrier protein
MMSAEPTVSTYEELGACTELIHRLVRASCDESVSTIGSSPGSPEIADSIMLAEVIVAIEEETGIEVPMDEATARALRSVDSFAALVQALVTQRGGDRVG